MAIPKGAASATPVEPGLLRRVVEGVRYAVTGQSAWFGPMQPLAPVVGQQEQPSVVGRQFDYPVGFNVQTTPRQNEPISFAQMRALADGYDVMRLVIETRKDQMAKMKWKIRPRDKKAKPDDRCKMVSDFLAMPDKEHTWDEWLRMLLEELFVTDAPTLYVRPTLGGDVFALEPIDGATIKRVLDEHGRTPQPPEVAYQQILKGVPAVDYTREELIYRPRNVRTHKVYGYSPVEQVIMTVNIALRRQLHQLQYYTEGNIPEALASVPANWNPDQIKQFQQYWDWLLEGDTAERRHLKFIPDGVKYIETKSQSLKDEYDEWLARVVCFAFSIAPTPFVKQQNRATAGTAHEQSLQEGLIPIMNWVKGLMDYVVVQVFQFPDLEYAWDEEEALDLVEQADIQDKKIRNGSLTINEARAHDGLEPVEGGDQPVIFTASGVIRLVDALEQAANPPPPPMPFGATAVDPEADDEDPHAGHDHGAAEKPDDKSIPTGKEAVTKAKKAVRSIDRERKSIMALQAQLQDKVAAFLKDQAPKIAAQVVAAKDEVVGKVDASQIRTILERLNFEDWVVLVGEIEPLIEALTKDGGAAALAQIGLKDDEDIVNLTNEKAVAWAKDRAAEWVGMKRDADGSLQPNPNESWQIDESTRELLNSTVAQAIDEGWSNERLAQEIEDSHGFSPERAEMIARTETAFADVAGNMEGYRASGQVAQKQWAASADCCDDCQALDGEVVDLDDNFPNDGGDGPPLHPKCRCDVLPVLTDESNNEE
ncbi:phage portal protein (plasmid) [Herbaspirillum seropedicae]|uniref:phage portal protein n=1 Tax=Herbaspirillum seropedicae TaxID=964 RepID=UPI00111E34A1|nr:phage portal protein [Herbaspirillum seropedicae]QDD62655.1 phage portal protein [Herbaspirillum seropedicae]